MHRVFYALPLTKVQKQQIASFQRANLGNNLPGGREIGRPVVMDNFHITLAFIGSVRENQIDDLLDIGNKVRGHPCQLRIDHLGFWPRPKVLFLGAKQVPKELENLKQSLFLQIKQYPEFNQGFQPPKTFKPHITLQRKAKALPEIGAMQTFQLGFERFSLFESISTTAGVKYEELKSWKLDYRGRINKPS